MRHLRRCMCVLLFAALARPAAATNAIVPDDYPTIQQGIDSGVDTVWVKPGDYHESPQLRSDLTLLAVAPYRSTPSGYFFNELPVLNGLASAGTVSRCAIRGLRILGALSATLGHEVTFTGCRFDAGCLAGGAGYIQLENCISFGPLYVNGCGSEIDRCTVIGGGLSGGGGCGTVYIHDNVVIGPAPVGISGGSDIEIDRNYVRDCVVGIRKTSDFIGYVVDNVVEDCSGNGFQYPSTSYIGPPFLRNVARRCGGRGFDLRRVQRIIDNVAEDCGLEGFAIQAVMVPGDSTFARNTVLRSGAAGIVVTELAFRCVGNQVIGAHGDGMSFARVSQLSGNVVGHCTGRGIVVTDNGLLACRNNTVYANGGAGLEIHSTVATDSITNNISAHNALGLAWSGPAPALLGCNDWFGNSGGDVTGTPVGATDVSLNPLFCDLPNDIVSLSAGSPPVSLAGCGQVGAQGVGCTAAASVPGGVRQHSATCASHRSRVVAPRASPGARSRALSSWRSTT